VVGGDSELVKRVVHPVKTHVLHAI